MFKIEQKSVFLYTIKKSSSAKHFYLFLFYVLIPNFVKIDKFGKNWEKLYGKSTGVANSDSTGLYGIANK